MDNDNNANIKKFIFEDLPFSVIDDYGQYWFIAKEVCEILGISKYRDAIQKLEEDEKGHPKLLDTLGGPQQVATISESGLYTLIIRSNKPKAKSFRKWITSEVLPSIRKTGSYNVTNQLVPVTINNNDIHLKKIISLQDEIINLYRKLEENNHQNNFVNQQPLFISKEEINEIKHLFDNGFSTKVISRRHGIPINKILEILKEEL